MEPHDQGCESVSAASTTSSRDPMNYSVALTSATHEILKKHLLRSDGQEDVCYALWSPGQGANRLTALVSEPILPLENLRHVHRNAITTSRNLSRVTALAKA